MSLVELPREQKRDSIPVEQLGEGHHSAQQIPYYRESLSKSVSDSSSSCSSSSSSPRLSIVRPSDSNLDTDTDTDNTIDEIHDRDDMLPKQILESAVGLAPALPARSTLRASRLLASLPQKLSPEEHPMLPHAAPHDVYLSEEDASSSADDFSDFESEPESDAGVKSHQRSSSHEDTARMVSVIFAGKPSIVELPPRSISPSSTNTQRQTVGLLRTATEPTLNRPRSTSTTSSNYSHPPRSSSMITSGGFDEKRRPSFLSIDPFAAKADPEEDSAKTPRTPGGMFKRGLSLVRKRSKPFLNQAANYSRESFSMQSPPIEQQEEAPKQPLSPPPEAPVTPKAPANYQDIMRAARKNAQAASATPPTNPQSPLSPNSTNSAKQRLRSGLSMGRRRSIKA